MHITTDYAGEKWHSRSFKKIEVLVSFPAVLEFWATFFASPHCALLENFLHDLNIKCLTSNGRKGSDDSISGWMPSFPPCAISFFHSTSHTLQLFEQRLLLQQHDLCMSSYSLEKTYSWLPVSDVQNHSAVYLKRLAPIIFEDV